MRYHSGRASRLPFVAVAVAVLALAAALAPSLAAEPATGRLWAVVKVSDNSIAEVPARASVVTADGRLLDYAEELLSRSPNVSSHLLEGLPEGTYDVRVEGEGLVTEVKRGVPVFAGRDERVQFVVRPGEGLHVVEYAVACLSREEVAKRLAHLESEAAALRAELAALRGQD